MVTAAAVKGGAELAKLGTELLGKVAEAVKGLKAAKVKGDWEANRLNIFKTHLRDLSTDLQTAARARTRPTSADNAARNQLTGLRDDVESIIEKFDDCLGSRPPEHSQGLQAIFKAANRQASGSQMEMHLKQAEDLLTTLL